MTISNLERESSPGYDVMAAAERESSPEYDIMAAAERALDIYCSFDTGERADFREHAVRTMKLVRAFAGNLIPREAMAATLLHDIADRLHNKTSSKNNPQREEAARAALGEFFTDPKLGEEQGEYILCLLADMIKIEGNSGEHRIKMAAESTNGGGVSAEVVKMISESYEDEIPPDVWQRVEPLLDFNPMRRHLKGVNLEAQIIKSCELIDNMIHPSSSRESAKLQDVLEAESFYAPTVEVLGIDGLASTSRGDAHILRMVGRGEHDLINQVREKYEAIERVGIDRLVAEILGGESTVAPAVGELNPGQGDFPVHIGEFVVDVGEDQPAAAGNYRLKTVGSWADKMAGKYDGEIPPDILGLTVISNDSESLANDFVNFIANRLPNFYSQTAKNKKAAIYVQGTTEYINEIKRAMGARGIDESTCQFEEDKDIFVKARGYKDYEVAKVTFITSLDGEDVPTEVQFVTKEGRKRARLGEISHIIYKYLEQLPKIDGQDRYREMTDEQKVEFLGRRAERDRPIIEAAVETLSDCYDRKENMSPCNLQVNRRSIEGGVALGRDIMGQAA